MAGTVSEARATMTIQEKLNLLVNTTRGLRKAQRDYMKVRSGSFSDPRSKEAFGKKVAEAAEKVDKALELVE